MKILSLYLQAFGPFTERTLNFSPQGQSVTVVYGPNETGKSSTLRAIGDLRFGIPARSRDDFVHTYAKMRIAGLFVDRNGQMHMFVRRKGQGSTLYKVNDLTDELTSSLAVPAATEALLTAGLSRDEYETMYGLDHQRLRDGGNALLKGEGEVGTALFEASAGVRSIPRLLETLDQTARQFFLPGTRGKNAHINEAIRSYEAQHSALRLALVRPATWSNLYRKHTSAQEEVRRLEQQAEQTHRQLNRLHELRAVAPLLASLDAAQYALKDLRDAPLLPEHAATDRAAAVAGLADARQHVRIAQQEIEQAHAQLQLCQPDERVLQRANAISRLIAAAETYARQQTELASADADVDIQTRQWRELAQRIDPHCTAEDLTEAVPTSTARVDIEHQLRTVEGAQQALRQNRDALQRMATTQAHKTAATTLPSEGARTTLRIALVACDKNSQLLQTLLTLPTELQIAQRELKGALSRLQLDDETALQRVSPLLPARIDDEIAHQNRLSTQIAERLERMHALSTEEQQVLAQHHRLLAAGHVPTWSDVHASRQQRDAEWATLRPHLAPPNPPLPSLANVQAIPAPDAFELAVQRADDTVDALARDTERAAQLQACQQELNRLAQLRTGLQKQIDTLNNEQDTRHQRWATELTKAQMPVLAPSEARDWQTVLEATRSKQARVHELQARLSQTQTLEQELLQQLRTALHNIGYTAVDELQSLDLAIAAATDLQDNLRRLENAANAAAGEEIERAKQRTRLEQLCAECEQTLASASHALQPALAQLRLPVGANVAVVRARLNEYDELAAAQKRLQESQARQTKARHALELFEQGAVKMATDLGHATPDDIRLYIDQLDAILQTAQAQDAQRKLLAQTLTSAESSLRRHEELVVTHTNTLNALCAAAGVDSPDLLPEAEDRSRRRRQAQDELDRTRQQLTQASRRPIDELRSLLLERDAASFEAEEAACQQQLKGLEEELRAARANEAAARDDLKAIDSSDAAATARDGMEQALARIQGNVGPWVRSRLAHALLGEALRRFQERAQGPMLRSASNYFKYMTDGEFVDLTSDDTGATPVLLAHRANGERLHVDGMSEGTRDQLYLALRLAALELRQQSGADLPLVLDDVLMTSDDKRAALMLQALARFSQGRQVIVFTHHGHLLDVAAANLPAEILCTVEL